MKYNLKNKPCNQSDEVAEWFEGFEKELRQLWLDTIGERARHHSRRLSYARQTGKADLLKEILGVSQI